MKQVNLKEGAKFKLSFRYFLNIIEILALSYSHHGAATLSC